MKQKEYMILVDNRVLGVYSDQFLDTVLAVACQLFKQVKAVEVSRSVLLN